MNVDRFWYANDTATIPAVWHYASGVFSFLCLIFGIVSNGLVIFVFIRNNALRLPRNYFLVNLAITDIGLLLTNNSMHVISSFKKHWIFGQKGCDFYSVCGGIFGLTSIATMALISLTRLAAVNDPFSSMKLSSHFTLSCLVCAWIYGSMWIMPPLFGWNRFILEGFGTSCTFDYISKDFFDRLFILVLVTGGFFTPLSIILLSYSFILIKLSQRTQDFITRNHDNNYSNEQGITYHFHRINLSNNRRTEIRATRTALLIFGLFCAAWGPYALMALISLFGFNYLVNAYTTAMLGMFTKVAACINPLIYALSLNGFREHICSYFKCFITSKHNQNRKKLLDLSDTRTTRQHT